MTSIYKFLLPTQPALFQLLCKMYSGKTICSSKNYVLVKGDAPIMLVAHLDTVHSEPVKIIYRSKNGNILRSPQGIGGDDRCGVFALVQVYKKSKVKPYMLFTCDEEIGGLGAKKFCHDFDSGKLPAELRELKMLVEIDRKGFNDAVFYDCDNPDFEDYIKSKGFVTAHGSFSDISLIAPTLGVAAVNLSAGYYHPHTLQEFINLKHLRRVISKVLEMVAESTHLPKFEYIERSFNFFYWRDFSTNFDEMYQELLEIYPPELLNHYRGIYGDDFLKEIYIEEYGGDYFV